MRERPTLKEVSGNGTRNLGCLRELWHLQIQLGLALMRSGASAVMGGDFSRPAHATGALEHRSQTPPISSKRGFGASPEAASPPQARSTSRRRCLPRGPLPLWAPPTSAAGAESAANSIRERPRRTRKRPTFDGPNSGACADFRIRAYSNTAESSARANWNGCGHGKGVPRAASRKGRALPVAHQQRLRSKDSCVKYGLRMAFQVYTNGALAEAVNLQPFSHWDDDRSVCL